MVESNLVLCSNYLSERREKERNTSIHTAAHCNTLHTIATRCNTLSNGALACCATRGAPRATLRHAWETTAWLKRGARDNIMSQEGGCCPLRSYATFFARASVSFMVHHQGRQQHERRGERETTACARRGFAILFACALRVLSFVAHSQGRQRHNRRGRCKHRRHSSLLLPTRQRSRGDRHDTRVRRA